VIAKKHIYFMRPIGQLGPIKIGCSRCVQERLVQIAAWSPIPLEIIHTEEGDHKLERNLHRCFADYHSHLEWFHAGERLLAAILKLRSGSKIAEAIDLSDDKGSIHAARRKQLIPELVGYKSYTMKMSWALKRARDRSKVMLYLPSDVDLIMCRWIGQFGYRVRRPPVRPTDEDFKRLHQFLDDPYSHCVTHAHRFPKKVAA
jgi:hypothetical protein